MKKPSSKIALVFTIVILLLLICLINWRQRSKHYDIPIVKSERVGSPNLYPSLTETPGAIDPRVTQANIAETICAVGWTKTIRPPYRLMKSIKLRFMRSRKLSDDPSAYELDHLIPLELGGCPDCEANLWLELFEPMPGAYEKDEVENYLHRQVCSGAMTLQEAQRQIAVDWYKVYLQISATNHASGSRSRREKGILHK